MTDFRFVFVTTPNAETSQKIAQDLVQQGLAACVNILPGVQSIYKWKGEICSDAEQLLIIKTSAAQVDALQSAVCALHPYDVPEIVALPIVAGSAAYLKWLGDNSQGA